MRMRYSLTAVATSLLLAACVTQMPQTAEEFREALPGAYLGRVEKFEVNRSLDDVARTFKRKAPECLGISVRVTSRTNTSYQVIITDYKPTVVVSRRRAELHLQRHFRSGVITVAHEPEGGYYSLVADAYPVSKRKTRLEVFMPANFTPVLEAIKGWASGNNLGCPDLTKI